MLFSLSSFYCFFVTFRLLPLSKPSETVANTLLSNKLYGTSNYLEIYRCVRYSVILIRWGEIGCQSLLGVRVIDLRRLPGNKSEHAKKSGASVSHIPYGLHCILRFLRRRFPLHLCFCNFEVRLYFLNFWYKFMTFYLSSSSCHTVYTGVFVKSILLVS